MSKLKVFSKNKLMALGLSITMVSSMVACSKHNANKTNNDKSSSTSSSVDETLKNDVKKFMNKFSENFYLGEDEATNSYIVMNIENLVKSNSSLLTNIFENGESVDKFIQDHLHYLSLVREYNSNINNSGEYLSVYVGNNEVDRRIINELETMTKDVIDGDNIENLFTKVNAFSKGEIALNIDGKDYYIDDLSIGGGMCYTVPVQIISLLSKDIVSEDKRVELDKLLNNSINGSTQNLTTILNSVVQNSDKLLEQTLDGYISEITEDGEKQVDAFVDNVNVIEKELKDLGIKINNEEVYCAQIIANLDYLQSNNVQKAVMATIINGRETENIIDSMRSFISKVEEYNYSVSIDDKYTYQDLYLVSDENLKDRIAVVGMVKLMDSLSDSISTSTSTQTLLENSDYRLLKGFHQYSSESGFKFEDNLVVKNNLDSGTVLIVNEISNYYTGKIISDDNSIILYYDFDNGDPILTGKNEVYELLNDACGYKIENNKQKVKK